jgi:hypothetical protein
MAKKHRSAFYQKVIIGGTICCRFLKKITEIGNVNGNLCIFFNCVRLTPAELFAKIFTWDLMGKPTSVRLFWGVLYIDISIRYPKFSRKISSRGILRFRYPEDIQLAAVVLSTHRKKWNFTPMAKTEFCVHCTAVSVPVPIDDDVQLTMKWKPLLFKPEFFSVWKNSPASYFRHPTNSFTSPYQAAAHYSGQMMAY